MVHATNTDLKTRGFYAGDWKKEEFKALTQVLRQLLDGVG